MFCCMALVDRCTKVLQALGRHIRRQIRTAHFEIKIEQYLGNTTHAGAANTDKMDILDLMFHSANSMHISATELVASGLPKLRAFIAMAKHCSRSKFFNMATALLTVNSVCGINIAAPPS